MHVLENPTYTNSLVTALQNLGTPQQNRCVYRFRRTVLYGETY